MTEPPLIERERALLHDLIRAAATRAAAEPGLERMARARKATIEREFEEEYQSIIIRFAAEKEAAERERTEGRDRIEARFRSDQEKADQERASAVSRARGRYAADKQAARSAFQEARWTIAAVLEGSKNDAEARLADEEARLTAKMERLQQIQVQATRLLETWNQSTDLPSSLADSRGKQRTRKVDECLQAAEDQLSALQALNVPRWLKGRRLVFIFLLFWLLLIIPLGLLAKQLFLGPSTTPQGVLLVGLAASTILSLLSGFSTGALLASIARAQVAEVYFPLCEAVADGMALRPGLLDAYQLRCRQTIAESTRRHNTELRTVQKTYRERRSEMHKWRRRELRRIEGNYRQQVEDVARQHAEESRELEAKYQRTREEVQTRYEQDSRRVQAEHQKLLDDNKAWLEKEWRELVHKWKQGLTRTKSAIAEIGQEASRLFPPLNDGRPWTPAREPPPVMRFGEFRVGLEMIPDGIPRDENLRLLTLPDFALPALCTVPERGSLLWLANEAGRAKAVESLQAMMFRLLAALPPGKVRFTIIDPVGLGENFAAFMHLADYDEALVASRIWTEAGHIEQRLVDLTAHMENVIQKYLRNQYQTISEYNAQAGEVAEPFRILVIANFPANFTPEAARRLVSIMQSGPRCGVSVLLSVDTKQPMPEGFRLADIAPYALQLAWQDNRFVWNDADFSEYPLVLDAPPPPEVGTRLLHQWGEKAREAGRVEVPFEFIAPTPEQWWTGDSRNGLAVALGRAGATRRQLLDLGRGTSQHVLVAGKTGSGKSTLLHVLITNLALQYAPDEVELYLIDFKKGVEFKTYATQALPHARVIAIESEREFGLSVLQRLDAELKARGDRFRELGVQNLAGFRDASPKTPLPRILLVVDEFQEFFIEDDRLSQDAAQLLDRLVRQGRAFGLHVLLGSQTLGGAYTLARSTIDQMAVRIALQCSEADAHLILSDDNSAARLLSRPGEAIYNDANGLIEGNNPFQIVWLGDDRRDAYLQRIRGMAAERQSLNGGRVVAPTVVFEGNVPADVRKNYLLEQLLAAPAWPAGPVRRQQAWLGEAIAIKDPTAALFRRQGGANLLVVGQQDDAALGILLTALVSLAGQLPPIAGAETRPQFYLVDGSSVDAPHHGLLAKMPGHLPHSARMVALRDLPGMMTELTAELERRQQSPDAEVPPLFVLIYGLQRCRDLRRGEDDFGFGSKDQVSPAQQFATLLREGAALGIHVLVWCDTLNTLQRTLERQALREFDQRVLFQMGVADSSTLIDTPLASKLGTNRALYHNEEEGRLEKFRPYGIPSEEWLGQVGQRLRGKMAGPISS